jgi:hypothetical protein
MVAQASGLGMVVGRFSRPRREVGVLAMPDARLDTTRCVESVSEVPSGAGVLRLLVSGMVVGVVIDRRSVADGVTPRHLVISARPELFSEDEGLEF